MSESVSFAFFTGWGLIGYALGDVLGAGLALVISTLLVAIVVTADA